MIQLILNIENNQFSSFTIEGHSSLGSKGNNLLCAGVSTLSQGIFLGLNKIIEKDLDYKKSDGYLYCRLPEDLSLIDQEKASVLFITLLETMKDLKKSFPDQIHIEWNED